MNDTTDDAVETTENAETQDTQDSSFDADALFDEESGSAEAAGTTQAGAEPAEDAGNDGDEEDPWAAALAEQEAAAAAQPAPAPEPPPANVRGGGSEVFQPLAPAPGAAGPRELDIVMNIPVKLNVELGRTKISIRQLLELAQGSVLELDGLAGDPMDILINGYLIAQGEVVVVEDRYGIRITDIITPTERVEKLNR